MLPHLAMYSGRIRAATSVIRAASRQLVWSFQSQHCAAGLRFHLRWSARGRFSRSTGIGLEPVVSTPIPTIPAAEKPRLLPAAATAPRTLSREGDEVVAGVLAGEVGVPRVQEDALLRPLGYGATKRAQLRAVPASDDERARRIGSKIDS